MQKRRYFAWASPRERKFYKSKVPRLRAASCSPNVLTSPTIYYTSTSVPNSGHSVIVDKRSSDAVASWFTTAPGRSISQRAEALRAPSIAHAAVLSP